MILINIAVGVFFVIIGSYIGGAIMLVFTLFYAYLFYTWRHRIPFAKLLLKTVTKVTGQYPATLFTGFVGLLFGLGFSALFIFSAGGWVVKNSIQTKTTQGGTYVVYIYLVFLVLSNSSCFVYTGLRKLLRMLFM